MDTKALEIVLEFYKANFYTRSDNDKLTYDQPAAELKAMKKENTDLKYERDNLARAHEVDRKEIEHYREAVVAYQLAVHEAVVATDERNILRSQFAAAQADVESAKPFVEWVREVGNPLQRRNADIWFSAHEEVKCLKCDHPISDHVAGHGCTARLWDKSECECGIMPNPEVKK